MIGISSNGHNRPLDVYRPYPKHYPSDKGSSGTGVTPGDKGVSKPPDSANPGLGSKDSKWKSASG